MPNFTDKKYLTEYQYKDSSNLDVRMAIHPRFSTNPYGWFNWVFDALSDLPPNAKILEVGCGTGHLWKTIAGKIPAGWDITLSDLSAGMLDAAWRNLVVLGRAFKFEQIDAVSIPYRDGIFDAVIANHMLYHTADRPTAIGEIRRILKPEGRLFATTVGERHMQEMDEWRKRAGKKYTGSFSLTFTLENGMKQLSPFFKEVQVTRYKDSLLVTDVDMIVAYLCSTMDLTDLDENGLAVVRAELENRLKQEKAIFITKDSGMLIATQHM